MVNKKKETSIFGNALKLTKYWSTGLIGAFFNFILLIFLRKAFGLYFFIAGFIGIESAIALVFFLNDRWTWKDREYGKYLIRFLKFNLASAPAAFLINYPVFLMLIYLFGVPYLIASFFGYILAGIVNFIINHKWTWGVYHTKKLGWIRTVGWVLFGFVMMLLVSGFLIFTVPTIQKYVVNVIVESVAMPIEAQYDRLSFSYGLIKIENLNIEAEPFHIDAEHIAASIPSLLNLHFRTVYIDGLNLKLKETKSRGSDSAKPGGIKLPISIKDFRIKNTNLDFGSLIVNNLYLNGDLEKDGIEIDSLYGEIVDRGIIRDLKGNIDFDDDKPAIAWDADLISDKSILKSNGSLLFSPLKMDLRASGDSVNLAEIDTFIGMGVLFGLGDVDIYITGSPSDILELDIYYDGQLFGLQFDTTSTYLTYLKQDNKLIFSNMGGTVHSIELDGGGEILLDSDPIKYNVDANVYDMDLEDIIEGSGLTSSFTGHLIGGGQGFDIDDMMLAFDAKFEKSSFWNVSFDSAVASIRLNGDSLYFDPMLILYREGNIINLYGNMAYEGNMILKADCEISNLSGLLSIVDLQDMIGGKGKCELNFTGLTQNPAIDGNFDFDSLSAAVLEAKQMKGHIELSNMAKEIMGIVDLNSKGQLWGFDVDSIRTRILINGNSARVIPLEVFRDNLSLYGVSEIEFKGDTIIVGVDGVQAQYDSVSFNLSQPNDLYFIGDKIYTDSISLALGGGIFRIEHFIMDSSEIELNGNFEDILAQNILQQFEIDFPMTASFDGDYYFNMPGSLLTEAYAVCTLWTDNISINNIPWENGKGVIELEDGIVKIPNLRFFKADEHYEFNGKIEPFKEQPEMDIWLEGDASSTAIMEAFSDQIDSSDISFDLKIRLLGPIDDLQLHGVLEVNDGYLKLFELQQPIENLYLLARLDDYKIIIDSLYGDIKVERTAREKGVLGAIANGITRLWTGIFGGGQKSSGHLFAEGQIEIDDFSNPFIDMDISSSYLPLNLHNQGIYLIVDSKIEVEGPMMKPTITSDSIRIIEGTVLGIGGTSSGGGSSVIPADLSVRVEIPDNFWIFTDQAEIEVGGDLVVETSQGVPYVQGNLVTKSGQYFTFGKTFEITEGRLDFTKVSEIDPELNITAVTTIAEGGEAVSIYLNIGGTLSNPQLNLTAGEGSNLSHGDLILLLTMHRTTGTELNADSTRNMLDQLEGKGTDLLREYQYYEVSKVAKDLIGVEQFEIVPMDNQNIWEGGDYQFIVGKYITPRLYLRYSQNIGSGVSEKLGDVQIEYQLTDYMRLIGARNYENPEKPENYKLELDFKWKF